MKISPRIPSIGTQESSEKEIKGQEKTTFRKSSEIASSVDKFEGPDSIQKPKNESAVDQLIGDYKNSRRHLQSQEPSIPDFPLGGGHTSSGSGLLGNVASAASGFSLDPQNSRGSRVNKYEGPNSLPLPEIESKAHSYKGPDSIELPQRSSRVDHYKGPDSIELPKAGSPVSNYQGPDSITPPRTRPHVMLTIPGKNKDGYPQSSEASIPDLPRGGSTAPGRGLLGDVSSAVSGFSSGPDISRARTSADRSKDLIR